MKIRTEQGRTFCGATAKRVVYAMMKEDFLVTTKSDYLLEVKERLASVFNIKITVEPGDFTGFLTELEKVGLITIELAN